MNLERTCTCGALYWATSPYDYSCPACWDAECYAAVRVIEWVGGVTPPGAMAIERTPITDTWDAAADFICGPWSAARYIGHGTIVRCLLERWRKPHTLALPLEYLTDEDIIASHPPAALYTEDPDEPGRAFAPNGDGWWWLDTEVAWVACPSEITCHEKECCLAQPDHQ